MEIKPHMRDLIPLIKRAKEGEIVLPEFQRNFVWTRDDVRDLLISILKKHFIGTFLFMEVDDKNLPFAPRPIAGSDMVADDLKPNLMVLDGQQRITSLYYAFYEPDIPLKFTKYPYRFFVDLKKVVSGDFDDAILSERADLSEGYYEENYQFDNLIVPFKTLLDWYGWIRKYETFLLKKNRDLYLDFREETLPKLDGLMRDINSARVPIIELEKIDPDDPEKIAEVCAIFEKMNSTGVELSVYDLLTARLHKDRVNLHELWSNALEEYSLLKKYSNGNPEKFGVFTLRVIAMMRGKEVKSKVLINLIPKQFEEDWANASNYMEKSLKRLTSTNSDGFGVFKQKWFPYTTMTPVLAAVILYMDSNDIPTIKLKAVKKWYWGSVFLERYAGSTDTIAYKDYNDLIKYFSDKDYQPEVFKEIEEKIVKNPNFTFKEVTRVSSIYKGIMNLITIKGAKDFSADDSIEFYDLDDHHIFPRAYLQRKGYSDDQINSVVNKTLISSKTNRRISKESPNKYMSRIIPSEDMEDILHSHYIGNKSISAMKADDFDTFLTCRDQKLVSIVRKLLSEL